MNVSLVNSSTLEFLNTTKTLPERPFWMSVLDKASVIIMSCNLILLMLGMGSATYLKEVLHNVRRPWRCLIGVLCQYGAMPAIGFGLCFVIRLPSFQALGVIILCSSPGGAFSNFFTYWIDGDLALSILMTAISSVAAFGLMPLNIWAYSRYWTDEEMVISYINILISLTFVTLPAIIGMIFRHYSRVWADRLSKLCGILGWIGALLCGIFLLLIYWEMIFNSPLKVLITSIFAPFLGIVIGYIFALVFCFTHKTCRTIAIETACQNVVVAINVLLMTFPQPELRGRLILFPVLYSIFLLSEILIAIVAFQIYKYVHRNDVTEEDIKSVIDDTVLTSVPIPGGFSSTNNTIDKIKALQAVNKYDQLERRYASLPSPELEPFLYQTPAYDPYSPSYSPPYAEVLDSYQARISFQGSFLDDENLPRPRYVSRYPISLNVRDVRQFSKRSNFTRFNALQQNSDGKPLENNQSLNRNGHTEDEYTSESNHGDVSIKAKFSGNAHSSISQKHIRTHDEKQQIKYKDEPINVNLQDNDTQNSSNIMPTRLDNVNEYKIHNVDSKVKVYETSSTIPSKTKLENLISIPDVTPSYVSRIQPEEGIEVNSSFIPPPTEFRDNQPSVVRISERNVHFPRSPSFNKGYEFNTFKNKIN